MCRDELGGGGEEGERRGDGGEVTEAADWERKGLARNDVERRGKRTVGFRVVARLGWKGRRQYQGM